MQCVCTTGSGAGKTNSVLALHRHLPCHRLASCYFCGPEGMTHTYEEILVNPNRNIHDITGQLLRIILDNAFMFWGQTFAEIYKSFQLEHWSDFDRNRWLR